MIAFTKVPTGTLVKIRRNGINRILSEGSKLAGNVRSYLPIPTYVEQKKIIDESGAPGMQRRGSRTSLRRRLFLLADPTLKH
jgi:hypothetical protein